MDLLIPTTVNKQTKRLGLALLAALLGASCGNPPPPASQPAAPQPTAKQPAATAKEPASKPAEPQPPAQPLTHFHFAVQGGAFAKRANAEALSLRLSGKYKRTTLVTPVEVGGKAYYRVRILVETRADADALAASLARDDGLNPWIIPLP